MKKLILVIIATALIAGVSLTSCNSPSEELENAQDNVDEANADLNKANVEYLADIEDYKKITSEKINTNKRSLADFKLRIEKEKAAVKAKYLKEIKELEQKNSDVEKKMEDYKAEGKEDWEKFKSDFSNEMDDIAKSIIAIAIID